MKIAVFGSAVDAKPDVEEKARFIGRAIARVGAVLITGACGGLPGIAAIEAKANDGTTVGYSPGRDLEEHKKFGLPTEGYSEFDFVKDYPFTGNRAVMLKYRNVTSCANSDACIIIGGRIGTVNEFTNMYDMGKVIGVLEGSGGCTEYLRRVIEVANKDSDAKVIFEKDPETLVKKIFEAIKSAN